MTFKDFKGIVDTMVAHHKIVNQAYKLNIDLIDFCDTQATTINALWCQVLTIEGKDWLDWFLYEKDYIEDGIGRKELEAWDDDGVEICQNLKGLYDYLTKNNYFKV